MKKADSQFLSLEMNNVYKFRHVGMGDMMESGLDHMVSVENEYMCNRGTVIGVRMTFYLSVLIFSRGYGPSIRGRGFESH